jgi:hypothetical protein
MPNVSNLVKAIQDSMRKDASTYGDAQRLDQLGWMSSSKFSTTASRNWNSCPRNAKGLREIPEA